MGRFAPIGVVALLVVGCGAGAPSRGQGERIADVRFDELGGELWSFSHRVSGSAPDGCVTVEVKRGPVRLRVPVRQRRFSTTVPLAPGENVVGAYCADPAVPSRDARVVYRVRLPATPRAVPHLSAREDGVLIDAGESAPNEGTNVPVVAYRWSPDRGNPAPLATDDGRPLDDARGERVAIASPRVDGEYVVWLTVTDAAGRRDRAGVSFVVEGGAARRADRQRWLDDAVIYGVVPFLFGEPAFDAVRDRLPELSQLGVDTLWLSPIFESPPDDYGYGVTDYFRVRDDWGSMQSFRALVDRAHELGMRVMLDFVPNHTSAQHRYFVHASRYGERSPYWGFYERDASGRPTHYFDWDHLPNLDYDNPEVRRWMTEAFSFWTRDLDVDGFRVDAAWGVAERAPGFFGALREELARIEPRVALVAEASARRTAYFEDGFDAAYDWTDEVGHWAWADVFHESQADLSVLDAALRVYERGHARGGRVLRFLDNNDTGPRFVSRHGAELERVAAALMFTVPGVPSLFTGQEVGARYQPYERQQPLAFTPDPSRFEYYRRLIDLRRREKALSHGDFIPLRVAGAGERVYAYARVPRGEGRPVIVVLDFGGQSVTARVELTPELTAAISGRRSEQLLGSSGLRRTESEVRVHLSPYEAAAWAFVD